MLPNSLSHFLFTASMYPTIKQMSPTCMYHGICKKYTRTGLLVLKKERLHLATPRFLVTIHFTGLALYTLIRPSRQLSRLKTNDKLRTGIQTYVCTYIHIHTYIHAYYRKVGGFLYTSLVDQN